MTQTTARSPFTPTHVAVVCHDGPDSGSRRKAAAQAHLAYIDTILAKLAVAGPLFSDDGATMIGSVYVFKTGSLDEARRLLEADPYFRAGFWNSVDYRPFLPAAGEYVGGKLW